MLLAMARYADEGAIAYSQHAFYTLTPGGQLPFSDEVIDLVDRISRDSGLDVDRFLARREKRPEGAPS